MLRTARMLLLLAVAVALPMRTVAAQQDHSVMTVSAAPSVSALPSPDRSPLAPLSLLGFALMGATADKPKTKKMNLSRQYLFRGLTYGPGNGVEVPEEFPELDDQGDVVHPPGSAAERNARTSRRLNATGPNTGGAVTGEAGTSGTTATTTGTGKSVSGKTAEDLEAMDKGELIDLAAKYPDVTVERLDDSGSVEDGEPLKRDYVRALSATATK